VENIMSKTIFTLIFFISLTCGGCVLSGTTDNSAVDDGQVLKVGITTDARPMAYRDNGHITGLEAEFARGLAKHANRRLHFVELPWKEQVPALLKGKIDIIMSGMTITQARKYQISFADPYMITGQVSLVRLAQRNKFSDGLTDLLSPVVRVGTVMATTGDLLIVQNKAKGKIFHYKDAAEGVRALLDKTIDAFVYDLPMNFYLGANYADQGLVPITVPMSREYIAWGIRNNDPELLSLANDYLNKLKTSGRLQQMIIHWVPFYKTLYNDELVKSHSVLKDG
jgi:polar amino acid transport system substrate-binding protein